MNYQKKEFQSVEESLHWISYNLKNLVKELQKTNTLLGIESGAPPVISQRSQQARNPYKAQQEEIPF